MRANDVQGANHAYGYRKQRKRNINDHLICRFAIKLIRYMDYLMICRIGE